MHVRRPGTRRRVNRMPGLGEMFHLIRLLRPAKGLCKRGSEQTADIRAPLRAVALS
ncbi:hypothetical protein SRIMM317S_04582 [Streptomyces rimosus subsp. rimosus]